MEKFFRFMGSLQLAVSLICLIAVFSIAGTLMPQGTEAEILKTTIPMWAKAFLLTTGMHQMFSSPPFLALLTAFLFSLALATQDQVWPPFRRLFSPPLVHTAAALKAMPVKVTVGTVAPELVAGSLRANGYQVWDAPTGPAAHKGRWSRVAPMLVHISLFMILIGVLVGGFWGFKGQAQMLPGESVSVADIITGATVKGPLVGQWDNWKIQLDKFWLEYYPNGAIQQFNSQLRVVKGDQTLHEEHIWVNKPLIFDGVTFYQANWDIGAVKLNIDGQRSVVPMFPIEAGGHAGQRRLQLDGQSYTLYLPAPRAPVLALDDKFQPVAPLVRNRPMPLGNHTVTYEELIYASGLQVKADPGINWVLGGFILISVGLILIFFNYRQVWFDVATGQLVGKANRGQVLLEQELERIAERLRPAAANDEARDLTGAVQP